MNLFCQHTECWLLFIFKCRCNLALHLFLIRNLNFGQICIIVLAFSWLYFVDRWNYLGQLQTGWTILTDIFLAFLFFCWKHLMCIGLEKWRGVFFYWGMQFYGWLRRLNMIWLTINYRRTARFYMTHIYRRSNVLFKLTNAL